SEWASYTLGGFVCLSCSGVHRSVPQVSKVKSARLDALEEAQVEFMASHGNNTARDTYECKVPSYYRPTFSDCQHAAKAAPPALLNARHVLPDQDWPSGTLLCCQCPQTLSCSMQPPEGAVDPGQVQVVAGVTHPENQEPYSAGYREGFLCKGGRDNGQLSSRKFVLREQEGTLKYFNRNDGSRARAAPCLPPGARGGSLPTDLRPDPASQAKEPKASMKIEHLNATFQPAHIGRPHGLQVTYLKDNSTRNIFVCHEDGKVGARLGASQGAAGAGLVGAQWAACPRGCGCEDGKLAVGLGVGPGACGPQTCQEATSPARANDPQPSWPVGHRQGPSGGPESTCRRKDGDWLEISSAVSRSVAICTFPPSLPRAGLGYPRENPEVCLLSGGRPVSHFAAP
ncbi:hypothetical protein MC885_006211, partial [Smutsia gigantea]